MTGSFVAMFQVLQFNNLGCRGVGTASLGAAGLVTVRLFFNSACALIWVSTCSTKCRAFRKWQEDLHYRSVSPMG
jgi:hypothetical protein